MNNGCGAPLKRHFTVTDAMQSSSAIRGLVRFGWTLVVINKPKLNRFRAVILYEILWKPKRDVPRIAAGYQQPTFLLLCGFEWERLISREDDGMQSASCRNHFQCARASWLRRSVVNGFASPNPLWRNMQFANCLMPTVLSFRQISCVFFEWVLPLLLPSI